MLGFMSLGSTGRSGNNCATLPEGEIFYNRHFECGVDFWETNAYGGILEVVAPSLVKFTAEDTYSSLTQTAVLPLPAGSYHLGVALTEVTGKGKFSYKLADDTWHTPITFNSAGTYEADITVDQEITAVYVGADNDSTFVATFDGISCMDSSIAHYPDWWKIATLNETDILGVWDFGSVIHDDGESARTNLAGVMPSFSLKTGAPSWQGENGMYFGGGGSLTSSLPDGIDINNITVLIEIDGVRQNATLDAFYSHFLDDNRYTLQNGWTTDPNNVKDE